MTTASVTVRQRNQAMECFKMIAAVLVVILHVPFPGKWGGIVTCLANFAVPVFFAITGYFNYGADCKTLTRRLKHLLKLYLVVIAASYFCGAVLTELQGGSTIAFLRTYTPDLEELVRWIVVHQDPRNGQLWYLTSACFCYLVLWLYVSFFGKSEVNYRPFYFGAFSLFAVFFALGTLGPIQGLHAPYLIYRNGYFKGLPMFALGIFLHEYQERIFENYQLTPRKLTVLLLGGAALGLAQGLTEVGTGDVHLGTLIQVPAIMMLLIGHPVLTKRSGFLKSCIGKFGAWSTWIYLMQIQVLLAYETLLQPSLVDCLGEKEEWWRPVFVVLLSFAVAMLFTWGEETLRKLGKRRASPKAS